MPVSTPDRSATQKSLWHLSEMLKVVRLLRGPLLASIAAALMLYLPDQIRELYRITAADKEWLDIVVEVCVLTAMFLAFWWVSYDIVQRSGSQVHKEAAPAQRLMALLPAFIAWLPLVACAGGLWAAQRLAEYRVLDVTSPWLNKSLELQKAIDWLPISAIALVVFSLLLAVTAYALQAQRKVRLSERRRLVLGGLGLVVLGVFLAVLAFPVRGPQTIGTLPLVAVFFIGILLVMGYLGFWYEKTKIPFLLLLVLAAFAFSAFNLDDNHAIAILEDEAKASSPTSKHQRPQSTWEAFSAWYKARRKKADEKSFPVYVVAAQGGGIYAAYHTATVLARIQDRCPEFSKHVFAISSVSGGSLGAAAFVSVTQGVEHRLATKKKKDLTNLEEYQKEASPEWPCPVLDKLQKTNATGPHEEATSKILASNFLAPLAGAALFPDFIQRFLPLSISAFDRARWLEAAFEESWHEAEFANSNPFEESVLKLWSPDGNVPALLINTTEVDTGRRLVIHPSKLRSRQTQSCSSRCGI